MTATLPVIDLSASDDALVDRLLDVYGTIGFGYIVGHGIAPETVAAVFEQSRRFHALPLENKMAIELNALHRGYIAIDTSTDVTSTLAEVTKPNQSESFMMMREAGPDDRAVRAGHFLAGANQWPADLPGFRDTLVRYHDEMCALAKQIVRVFAQGLGDDGVLEASFDPPTTWLRLLRYPPRPAAAADDLYGSAPHVDFGCITILAQDDNGGLEVRTAEGDWIAAPPMEGAFVVNVGTMLHRWSNGRLLATPHRVVNRSGRERYSIPFFYDPAVDVVVEPLACCVDDANPQRFEPVLFERFLREQLGASYVAHGARPDDVAKDTPRGIVGA